MALQDPLLITTESKDKDRAKWIFVTYVVTGSNRDRITESLLDSELVTSNVSPGFGTPDHCARRGVAVACPVNTVSWLEVFHRSKSERSSSSQSRSQSWMY